MAYYTKEQIEKARQIDLLTYLQTHEPTELVRLRGDTYCTREHDSLKISNGKWMWWSRGFGGASALDFLIKVRGLNFTDAMRILTEGASAPTFYTKKEFKSQKDEEKRLLLPEKSKTNNEVIRYLTGRGINKELIEACIRRGVLYESLPYHNCIFVGMDSVGVAKYACFRSANDYKLMGDCAGSDKRYSFRTSGTGNMLHVFECPIDLLSYLTLMHRETGRWIADPMLSLGGVYEPNKDPAKQKIPVALQNMLDNHPEVTSISLHLDNDHAGKAAAWSIEGLLKDKYNVAYEPPLYCKDYNDYLRHLLS